MRTRCRIRAGFSALLAAVAFAGVQSAARPAGEEALPRLFQRSDRAEADWAERAFVWNEANAMALAARTPEDYGRALAAYRRLLDLGARNGPLFYNVGTVCLHAGRYDDAIEFLLRAERDLGAHADIKRNLRVALAGKTRNDAAVLPWYRVVLFWHFALPAAVRAQIALLAFTLFWFALAARVWWPRRWLRLLAGLAALALVLFGSSAVTSAQQEANARPLALIAPAPQALPLNP